MVDKPQSINEQELAILEFWSKNDTFKKTLEKTKNNEEYVFYDGPPFATGSPHYGHLLGSIIKDIYGRFHTMQGKYVRRVWGWDCHGLPIENIAEKGLKINSKDEIEKMGVKKFNDYCRSKVLSFTDEWKRVINRIGRWVDMDSCYKTMDNNYIESVWWAFKQMYDKGFIYEGEKVLMFCPRCSTPLAKAEIAMDNSYKNVKDLTVTVKFKLINPNLQTQKDTFALAWTTTPWTLPSNLALSVNPKIDYAYIYDKSEDCNFLLAEELIGTFYKSSEEYEIVKKLKGAELENITYEPLFPYFKDNANSFKILLGDFVTAQDGTGIVHIAPAFGEEDYAVARKYQIKMVQPVDDKGKFTQEVTQYAGQFVHDTNLEIVKYLKINNKAVMSKKIEHEYPFCYRCDTKLLYRAIPAWFVDIQKIKPRLLELNQDLNWHPGFLKDGRVQYSVENAPDWNISRNRYWATAIPIWMNEDKEKIVIGSIEELKKYATNMPDKEIDLHKDYLDDIILKKDGKQYERIPEVIDCWFESGSMPFAQYHYPFENKHQFEKNMPADFVAEYIAQVRAWFYYMNVISAIIFDKVPFKNIVTTGTVMAEDGNKMSKSIGNFVDPMIIIEKFGVDALRFYLASSPLMNADNVNFSEKQVEEVFKKVIVLLHNVKNFYALYPNIQEEELKAENIMDKWILSKSNKLSKHVEEYLKAYNTVKTGAEIKIFIDDLSTWYVRQTRDRFNVGDPQAKATLKYVLQQLSTTIAPIMPFIAEQIHQTIKKEKTSVHMENYTKYDKSLIDEELINTMEITREAVSTGLRQRDQAQIGLKWPLQKVTIETDSGFELDKLETIIKGQLNVKEIDFKTTTDVELKVTLDTQMNPELEAEGYTREIIRKIQAARKKAELIKDDKIIITLKTEFDKDLDTHQKLLQDTVGAQSIKFSEPNTSAIHSEDGKIKKKQYSFSFSKI
ncbi:MAG: isoleucyl-tRNA synthetase [Patescibacteria group bacterium]|jgi:isoleucyl-tRNA synthetase